MRLSTTRLLHVSITTSSKEDILSYIAHFFSTNSKLRTTNGTLSIVTPNPEQIVLAQKNEAFRRMLNEADIALPDGVGIVWAMNRVIPAKAGIHDSKGIPDSPSSFRDDKRVSRISGVDFMVDLCRLAAEKKKRVFFYGGRGGVAGEALKQLKERIPDLDGIAEDGAEMSDQLSAVRHQPSDISHQTTVTQHLMQVIRSRNIDIVFIGLGAPKQECLMDKIRSSFIVHSSWKNQHKKTTNYELRTTNSIVFMTVGGAFDMLAGKVSRAPKSVQTIGLEWFWRLIQEPWRWKRQWALVEFIRLVLFGKSNDN